MIGGNIKAVIQIGKSAKNELGEGTKIWTDEQTLKGWIDMLSGNAYYKTYNAKIEESTHIFICDYVPLNKSIKAENARMVVNDKIYDITFIDNPMELNKQLEFYLNYVGGN